MNYAKANEERFIRRMQIEGEEVGFKVKVVSNDGNHYATVGQVGTVRASGIHEGTYLVELDRVGLQIISRSDLTRIVEEVGADA